MATHVKTYGAGGDNPYYVLFNNNEAGTSYQKNGTGRMGYSQRNTTGDSYAYETLMIVDLTGIPAGSTINSVTIDVEVTGTNLPASPSVTDMDLMVQNKADWTDTGSLPNYDSFARSLWNTQIREISNCNTTTVPIGTWTWSSSANMVSKFQGYLDGTYDTDRGMIFTAGEINVYPYNVQFNLVTVTIDYTGTTPSTRRKILII